MYNFSLQIDDDKHRLNANEGIPLDLLSDLLKSLYKAIDDGSKANCTLSNIRGNCYALDFTTFNENLSNKFIQLHKDLNEIPFDYLEKNEQVYANNLRILFKNGFYINAYDTNKNKIAHLTNIVDEDIPEFYYVYKTVYGYISKLGSDSLKSNKSYVKIDTYPKSILIKDPSLDLKLKPLYKTDKIAMKIKIKKNAKTGNDIHAETTNNFRVLGKGSLIDNLKEQGYINLEITKDSKTIDDILKSIYGYQ